MYIQIYAGTYIKSGFIAVVVKHVIIEAQIVDFLDL